MRTHTVSLLVLAAALPLLLWAPARADGPPADADANAAKAALTRFESSFDSAYVEDQLKAVRALARVQHPTVSARLLRLLARSDSEPVRVAVAEGLALQPTSDRRVGPVLQKLLGDTKESPRVVAAAVTTVGALEWRKATSDLQKLIGHDDDGVVVATFSVYGRWKDASALRAMLDFFTMYPDERSFATGTVTVDTGAPGGEDQAAAQAGWKAKYGSQSRWRPRPECTRALAAALKEITGFGFRRPEDLAEYMNNPKTYVDPETIAERMPEDRRREVWDTMQANFVRATEQAAKDVPGDDDAKRRANAYWKHLRKARKELLDKHKLRLSELIVILEEGDERKWPKS
jgi:hypothetical protein